MTTFTKRDDEAWYVQKLPGTDEMFLPKDCVAYYDSSDGLYIYHRDAKDTFTYIPAHAVTLIRAFGRPFPKTHAEPAAIAAGPATHSSPDQGALAP